MKTDPDSPLVQMKEAGDREFFSVDYELLDDRIVFKFVKCLMQDWNGGEMEAIKQAQESIPPELVEALKGTTQFA
jgi:hypothetical protein